MSAVSPTSLVLLPTKIQSINSTRSDRSSIGVARIRRLAATSRRQITVRSFCCQAPVFPRNCICFTLPPSFSLCWLSSEIYILHRRQLLALGHLVDPYGHPLLYLLFSSTNYI